MNILFQNIERNTHIFVEKVIFERIISSNVETSSSDMFVCLYVYVCNLYTYIHVCALNIFILICVYIMLLNVYMAYICVHTHRDF